MCDTHCIIRAVTFQVVCGPVPELTGTAGVLVKHVLVVFTGRTRPAAAHLTFTDHLERRQTEDIQVCQHSRGRDTIIFTRL